MSICRLFILCLFIICTSKQFSINTINEKPLSEAIIVIQYQQGKELFIQGNNVGIIRSAILQNDCMSKQPNSISLEISDMLSDQNSLILYLPEEATSKEGHFHVCAVFQNEEDYLLEDLGIQLIVVSLFQYCHTLGENAKAIRNCIKTNGAIIEPKKNIALDASLFKKPKYPDLSAYYESEQYKAIKKKHDEKPLPSFARNSYDYGMVQIPGGRFMMGSDCRNARLDRESGMVSPGDGEYPLREARIKSFFMDRIDVTYGQFKEFVEETGYITDAELYGWSFVFDYTLPIEKRSQNTVDKNPWWSIVLNASWRFPYGKDVSIPYEDDYPVVHVSHRDAKMFCAWKGKRLPTEGEWEYAARGGLSQKTFPWGDEKPYTKPWYGEEGKKTKHRCNLFQGQFPFNNTAEDGFYSVAPATSFEPNHFGLYNMVGNVWDWVADQYSVYHTTDVYEPLNVNNSIDVDVDGSRKNIVKRVSKGGSWICFYPCARNSARQGIESDSSSNILGFRCARDLHEDERDLPFEIHHGKYIGRDALEAGIVGEFDGETEGSKENDENEDFVAS